DGSTLRLSVSDTGIGISEDFLPRVFERFSQEDSSLNRHHGGLGLGLSISRHLAELHDGRLTATSAGRGKGATFELALPLQVPQHRPAATSARKDGAGNTTHSALQGQRVLLVEDVADSRELVREVLSERGAEVLALGTAK